jgi:nickel-dependent lactate racemase
MVTLPLGESTTEVSLPDCSVTVATPPGGDAVDPERAARDAMATPRGQSLTDRVAPEDSVAIVVTDVTRATPDDVLLGAMIEELDDAGVDREQITVVVGLGLHRPLTDAEIEATVGEFAPLAINHDPDATVTVGDVDGVDIEIHEAVAAADRVLSTGMVEPHQYAGFSGGAKTAVVGAGGESQIAYTHGPELLGEDGVRLGRIRGNPFREFLDRAGDLVGVDFCLNVTHGPSGILDAAAGDPRAVVGDLAESAKAALSVELDGTYDVVITGVGAPKDANLYQTTRAATYAALGDYDPLRDGGRLVLPATLPEGAGEGTGEQRFHDWLSNATGAESLYDEMARGYKPGAQRAFVVARVLRAYDIWVTNSTHPEVVEDCLMRAAETPADAVDSDSEVLVVPDALNTLLVG